MKLALTLLAASVVTAHAVQCDLAKLQPLVMDPAVKNCTDQSTYVFVPPTRPTDEQLLAICKSDACKQVLGIVAALPDCAVGTVSITVDLIDRVAKGCAVGSGGGGSTTPPALTTTTTATPTPTTTAPSPSATNKTTTQTPTTATLTPATTKTATPTATTPRPATTPTSASSKDRDQLVDFLGSGSSGGAIAIASQDTETLPPASKKPVATPTPAPKASGSVLIRTGAVAITSLALMALL